MIAIKENICTNLSENQRCKAHILIDSKNSITVYIDIPKWLYNFYKSTQLCIIDMWTNTSEFLSNDFLSTLPSSDQKRFYFVWHDKNIECSDYYWLSETKLSSADIKTYKSILDEQIENRLDKLKELYLKVSNKKISNSVDDVVKNILSNKITVKPKYSTNKLDEIPYTYPFICDFPPEPEKPKCQISNENYRGETNMGYAPLKQSEKQINKGKIEVSYKDISKLKPKNTMKHELFDISVPKKQIPDNERNGVGSLNTLSDDETINKLIKDIIIVLENITPVGDLSEETYKIKSMIKDINILISSYLNIKPENRESKKTEIERSLKYMLKTAIDYSKMVEGFIEIELNTQIRFIEYKYK